MSADLFYIPINSLAQLNSYYEPYYDFRGLPMGLPPRQSQKDRQGRGEPARQIMRLIQGGRCGGGCVRLIGEP